MPNKKHNSVLTTIKKASAALAVALLFFCNRGIAANASLCKIPSSTKSQKVIERVRPKLIKELKKVDLEFGRAIFIRIFKEEYELEVWIENNDEKFQLFKTYKICNYGSGALGPKIKQGDGQAPEGFYYVGPYQLNPLSNVHLSFNLGYPNAFDRAWGRTGNQLMVHGRCASIGCYAMTDSAIEEIYTLADASLRNGQQFFRVHIFPFRMTKENLDKHKNSKWKAFWKNLKEGYDFFEKNGHLPPNVKVRNKKYVFERI